MKLRITLFTVLILAMIGGYLGYRRRDVLPEQSSSKTFVNDVLNAKRICGDNYAAYLYYANQYVKDAFKAVKWDQAVPYLKGQPLCEVDFTPGMWIATFEIDNAAPAMPEGLKMTPTFSVSEDPFSHQGCDTTTTLEFTLDESSAKVRAAMTNAGGFLKEIAARPGFADLVRNYPTALSGQIQYTGDGRFDLQLKFLSTDLDAMSIRYSIEADMEPRDTRYVKWLPIAFRQRTGKVKSIFTQGESRAAQLAYEKKEVLQTLNREDLVYEYDIPPPTVSLRKLSELQDLPESTESISFTQHIDLETAKELSRFGRLRHLRLGTEWSDDREIDQLPFSASIERLTVYGSLTHKAVQSIVALPKLKELMLDVPDLRPADLLEIFSIPTLRKLYVNSPNINEIGFAALANNSTIRALRLGEKVPLNDLAVASLGRMKGLDWLEICGDRSALNLTPIYRLPSLKHLYIANIPLSDKDIAGIAGMPILQSLVLDKIPSLTQQQLFSFAKIRTLREFYLSETPGIRARDMRKLATMLEGKWTRR